VDAFHRELGRLMWDECGMTRDRAGLERTLKRLPALREEFWGDVAVTGSSAEFNQNLEKAGRVADFLEFAEVMCRDALEREESCGAHFRQEHQTEDGEAKREDDQYMHVAAWAYRGSDKAPERVVEPLHYDTIQPSQRSYK
jgi:succinate dehydrogenase / fumarate reductase flavoprotein subunit